MKHFPRLLGLFLFCASASVPAANSGPAPSPSPSPNPATTAAPARDNLAAARGLIAAKRWAAAIEELKRVNATDNADWNNLMGYSHRKATTPDLPAGERYYEAALRLQPQHRGALEYSGELFLMLGNLPRAEERLAQLDKACRLPCEEYTDLKNAVARFKANGNRYVAEP
ncbi:MAG TPA: tetratricopeptide repeat protein [Rubrivivax sp.]|nr:tetratricopeptide repeat protein [Rubrivivax sp.]